MTADTSYARAHRGRLTTPRAGYAALLAVALVLPVLAALTVTPTPSARAAVAVSGRGPNPVLTPVGGVAGVAFYYQGTVPLVGSDPDELAAHLGHPAVVVTTPGDQGEEAVDAIHAIGAKAYRYFQLYWAPERGRYDGFDLQAHPGWAFCRRGDRAAVGRVTSAGPWVLLDANERAVRQRIRERLADFAAEGWDGVFFDRGQAATQYAVDVRGRPVWHRVSTCTRDPHRPRADFATAYVRAVGQARRAGLQAMMNNGWSPFDPVLPMRPEPRDADCRQRDWDRCARRADVWRRLDLVLSEVAAAPRGQHWWRTFRGNQRAERHDRHGRRTVALITTATLGGVANQDRRHVVYAWSRIKLFDLAVGVNTGDGGCGSADDGAVCNRYGVHPDLVQTRFGEPLGVAPRPRRCEDRAGGRCVWVRTYARGASVVNAQGRGVRDLAVRLGTPSCRHVLDVLRREPLAGNRCVTKVRFDLGRWQGRPLRYSAEPWPGTG